MRWARARPASRRSCPAIASSRTQQDRAGPRRALERARRAHSGEARSRLSGHHRSRAREEDSRAVDHRHESDRVVPEPQGACSRRSKGSSSSSCRTAITRRPPPNTRTSCCRRRCGARRKGPTPTPSAASAKSIARSLRPAKRSRTSTSFSSSPARWASATSSFPAGRKPADAFEEWKRVSAGRLCDYSGITYKAIEQHGGVQWPFPAGATNPGETRRLYAEGGFRTDDGRARLLPVAWEPFPEQPNDEFPFVLNTGRTVEHWHTRTKTGKVPILERLSPNAWVEMNPRDARGLRLRPQDRVDVVSRRGRVRGIELRVTETVAQGQISSPSTTPRPTPTRSRKARSTRISREPNYKQSACARWKKASRRRRRRVR